MLFKNWKLYENLQCYVVYWLNDKIKKKKCKKESSS